MQQDVPCTDGNSTVRLSILDRKLASEKRVTWAITIGGAVRWLCYAVLMVLADCSSSAAASVQKRIDQLSFKGTHNSYASECGECKCPWGCDFGCSCPNSPPNMNHSPAVQVDAFGVWVLELDFSVQTENGTPQLIVGHSGSNDQDETWANPAFGRYVRDYLLELKRTQSFEYRPLFVFFEKKNEWGDDEFDAPQVWGNLLEAELVSVFSPGEIYARDEFPGTWPIVSAVAGQIVAFTDKSFSGQHELFTDADMGLTHWYNASDDCTNADEIQSAVAMGANLLRWDQYSGNWSFECGLAPPNPVCVDGARGGLYLGPVPVGQPWSCDNGDSSGPVTVLEQGTFAFPYDRVSEAVERAVDGWTVCVAAGNYPEQILISKSVTLRAMGGFVLIGR